jgi:glycosyl hydrolase family 26
MRRTQHRFRTRWAAAAVVATVAIVVAGGMPSATAAHKVLFGAHVSPRWGLGQGYAIQRYEGKVGRKFAIVNRFKGLSDPKMEFAAMMVNQGRIPMMSWRAVDHKRMDPNRALKIARGDFDTRIRVFANSVRSVGAPVLIRFSWEMTQAPGHLQYIGTPAEFKRAWRHVVSIFRAQGATNAKFIWAPQARSFCNGKGQGFYPGDAWVDWIGGSAVPGDTWTSYQELFHCFYPWAAPRGKKMITWFGIRERPGDASWKAGLLRGTLGTLKNSMPKIDAIIYFNSINGPNNFWADTSGRAFTAYKTIGCAPYFAARFSCR